MVWIASWKKIYKNKTFWPLMFHSNVKTFTEMNSLNFQNNQTKSICSLSPFRLCLRLVRIKVAIFIISSMLFLSLRPNVDQIKIMSHYSCDVDTGGLVFFKKIIAFVSTFFHRFSFNGFNHILFVRGIDG